MAIETGREDAERVAGPPPESPEKDSGEDRRHAAAEERRVAGRSGHETGAKSHVRFIGHVGGGSPLARVRPGLAPAEARTAPRALAPRQRRQDTVAVPERQRVRVGLRSRETRKKLGAPRRRLLA